MTERRSDRGRRAAFAAPGDDNGGVEADVMLELAVARADAELAADSMWQAGASAVLLREQGATTTVCASFPTVEATRTVAREMAAQGAVAVNVDPSWRDGWRQYATPVPVGEHLLIAPGWRKVPIGSRRLVLSIDPGPCFGSGTHPSTRLILTALEQRPPIPAERVVDVGCGSGILAVAAARLGATDVSALDTDPEALAVSRANAEANGVAPQVHAYATDIAELRGPFHLALVNVTAAVHAEVAPAVTAVMAPGGRMLLAGLLPGQWRHVAPAYTAAGARVSAEMALEGWEGLELVV